VSVAAKVSGNFANIAEAQDRVIGSFDFKGSKGVLRALNQKATQTSNVAKGVAIGAALLGGFLGDKAPGHREQGGRTSRPMPRSSPWCSRICPSTA
jgi:hypothetical protein